MNSLEFRKLDMSVSVPPCGSGTVSLCDSLFRFCKTFTGGKTYALIGSLGSGNCALPYILHGDCELRTDSDGGNILINGKIADNAILTETVCYVGTKPDEISKSFLISRVFKRRTVAELIEKGLKKSQSKYSLKDIAEIFHLSGINDPNGRIYRPIELTSGEKWLASLAIGFAGGKKIFAYPLLTDRFFIYVKVAAENGIFDFLKREDSIILVPAVYAEQTSAFADETVLMNELRQTAIDNESKNDRRYTK